MFKVTYAFEIIHMICVHFELPPQTLAPQPQKRPLHFVSLFFICSTHNPQPPTPFSPSNEKEDEKKKNNNNNLYFLWNCWSHLWLHWRGRVKPLKWHGDRSCVTLQRVWKKLENWAAQPPHPPSGGEERKKKKHKADKHVPHGQHKHPETPALSSRPPPRPKHRLVPRDYTSNDYTIPALALRGAN